MTDEELIEAFIGEYASKIESLVTDALRAGHALGDLALLLERTFAGVVIATCESREELEARLARDARFDDPSRRRLVQGLRAPGGVPAIVIVACGEGALAVGVRHFSGSLVGMA